MIKRILFAALVFAAPACLVLAQDAKISVDMIGIGGMSCAHWRSTQEHRLEGDHLDLRFLDGTQLRCCGERSNTGENRRGGDSERSRKDMCSSNVADISQRRMDHLSWIQEVTMPRRPLQPTMMAASSRRPVTVSSPTLSIVRPWFGQNCTECLAIGRLGANPTASFG